MPQLTWDDKILVQSNTITRFVAREVGIAGKNNMEMAQCDAIAEFCSEVTEGKVKIQKSFLVKMIEKCSSSAAIAIHPFFNANAPEEAREKFKGKLDNFIKKMEMLLDENGGEWMVGKAFTWADLYIAVVLQQVSIQSFSTNELQ